MKYLGRNRFLFAVVSGALALGGCSGSEAAGPTFEVSFGPGTPRTVRDQAARVEVYLVDGCDDIALGARDVPSIVSTSVLRDDDGAAFGASPAPGKYGLYAVAQDADCAVVAAGCATVTVTDQPVTLSVTLSGLTEMGCPADQVCSLETGDCQYGGGTGGTGGAPPTRVDTDLIVLYDFDEASGSTVRDRSGVSPALDLTIADPENVTWASDHLTIDAGTVLSTAGAATKVHSEVVATNEITVEAWVRPTSLVAVGVPPDRILSMSTSSSLRNVLLGQDAETFAVRFRAEGDNNGNPTVVTSAGSATTSLTHVVYTHRANGSEVIYIDGIEDTTFDRPGDTSAWDASYPLVVANEAGGGREWLGELHLIAIYDRALDVSEVQRNFAAGP